MVGLIEINPDWMGEAGPGLRWPTIPVVRILAAFAND